MVWMPRSSWCSVGYCLTQTTREPLFILTQYCLSYLPLTVDVSCWVGLLALLSLGSTSGQTYLLNSAGRVKSRLKWLNDFNNQLNYSWGKTLLLPHPDKLKKYCRESLPRTSASSFPKSLSKVHFPVRHQQQIIVEMSVAPG